MRCWSGSGFGDRMDRPDEASLCRFDDFLLDLQAGVLLRFDADGTWAPVPLGSRGFQIFNLLIERRPAFVSKQEIMDAVWPDVTVEENNLTVQMSALRRVLDKGRTQGSCIRTIPGRGYRFLPEVIDADDLARLGQNHERVAPGHEPAATAAGSPDTEPVRQPAFPHPWR